MATARDPASLAYLSDGQSNLLKLALNVSEPASVEQAFAATAAHFGAGWHVDALVNCAGYSLSGDTEAATEDEMHAALETVFFGTVRVTMAAVGVMRQHAAQRGGVVFNISSVAGICAFPGHAFYHAGKFAVEGWSESVAREMHPDWNSAWRPRPGPLLAKSPF